MPKHPRKRQKRSNNHDHAAPTKAARLAMLLDDESKDDEERRLESMLFGVEYQPRAKSVEKKTLRDSEEDTQDNGRGMQHLLDQDLFFIDNTLGESASNEVEIGEEGSGSDSHSDSDESESEAGSRPRGLLSSSYSKAPAWIDPADAQPTKISLLNGPSRLRKLRQAVDEDEITGREYETRLRNQFERINPEPEWARKVRREKGAKRGGEDSDEGEVEQREDRDAEGMQELLTSTGGILANTSKKGGRVVIRQGSLSIDRVRDANHSTQSSNSGEVRVVAFHPKPAVPVLCVATTDRRVRLFHIDGHLSPLLTTLHIPSLPVISSSVLFHPSGNSILVSGPRPFFYTYDLQQGTSTLHRRGLWGTGFDDTTCVNPSAPLSHKRRRGRSGEAAAKNSGGAGRGGGGGTEAILNAAFSGGTGSMLAVAGRGGNVHIVDWRSGAGQVVGSLRCTTIGGGGGGVAGLWWVPSSTTGGTEGVLGANVSGFGDCEKHLAVLTGEAEVYIWDVGQRRCVRRWKDEGGYRGAGRAIAGGGGPNGWLAIGSTSGYVNVYGSDSFAVPNNSFDSASSFRREDPKMIKALGNLTTPISTLKFNHDGQILAMASLDKKDALRFVHLPSLTAFANWPTSNTPLGHVTAVDFASRSEYVAIGNTRGRVLLYHLKDYGAGGGGVRVGY